MIKRKYLVSIYFGYVLLGGLVSACQQKLKVSQKMEVAPKVSFPRKPFTSVKLLSLNRALDTLNINELVEQNFMFVVKHAALGFVDKNGKPYHKYYTEKELSELQIKQLLTILRPTGPAPGYTKGCIAVYRDVIVFYNEKNKPVAHLQLCFECELSYFSPEASYMGNFDNEGRFEQLTSLFESF
jgi:hypothetical protein